MPFFGPSIRNGLPIGLGSVAGFGIAPFSPADLFSAGEQGVWYDPSDYSTLFTDSAGTTPVTAVEQFVGLMLDKSKGAPTTLGAELVTNGTFDTNTSGWTAVNSPVLTVGPNGVTIQNNGATNGILYQALTLVPGRTYRMEVTITYGGGFARVETSATVPTTVGGANINANASGRYQYFFTAATATTYLVVGNRNDANASNTYDNISVREIPGNHATSTGTKRPKLAARYNLLTQTEFGNGLTDAPIRSGLITASSLSGYAGAIAFGHDGLTNSFAYKDFTTAANTSYVISVVVKMDDGLAPNFNSATASSNQCSFALVNASDAVNPLTYLVTNLGNGFFRVSVTYVKATVGSNFGVLKYASNDSRTFKVTAYDLRPTSQATGLIGPTYQRVAAATDYDTAGFLPYLAFDGVDDSMSTGSIDATAVDKAQVFAGVRKLSDAAIGVINETSANAGSNNGSLSLTAAGAGGAGAKYGTALRGTTLIFGDTATSYTAPITNVLTEINDIAQSTAATEQILRINGAQASLTFGGADAGTGNFGNYPLYLGGRGGTSLYFNGWLLSLIVRFGATLTQSQIEATESWVNQRTGAY